jgi:Glycosyltransferase family 87
MHTPTMLLKQLVATRDGRLFAAILIGAISIRVPLMTFRGYYSDLATSIGWGNIVTQHFTSIYTSVVSMVSAQNGGFAGVGPGGLPGGGNGGFAGGGALNVPGGFATLSGYINYPPGMPFVFGALVFVYNHLLAPISHVSLAALVTQNGLGPFVAKIPLLVADIAALGVLYRQARMRHSERFALLAAAAYSFSPAVLYNGAIWGQTDGFVALPVLIALFAVLAERYVLGGASLAVAVLLKPQPVIFVPLVLLYLWRWSKRDQVVRFTAAGLLTAMMFLLPIIIPHFQVLDMLGNMQAESYNDSLSLSSDAFTFWWLIGYGQKAIGSTLLGVKSGLVGDALVGAVTVLCGVQIWRHREPLSLVFGMALQLFAFFMFMGGQHERYLFLFIPLALTGIIIARREDWPRLIVLYVIGTALCLLNMVIGVGGGIFANGQPIPFLTLQSLSEFLSANFAWLSNTIAFLHLATFIYALWVYRMVLLVSRARTSWTPRASHPDSVQPIPIPAAQDSLHE